MSGEDTDMEGRRPCEDRIRDWGDADQARKGPSQRLQRENRPANTLIFGLLASKTVGRINFCCLWCFVIAARETNVEGTLSQVTGPLPSLQVKKGILR